MKSSLTLILAMCMLLILPSSCLFMFNPEGREDPLDPVADEYDAEDLVERIAEYVIGDNVREGLTSSTPSGEVVYGITGTATVTGTSSYTSNDCGTDCISSTNSADLEISFDNYKVSTSSNCTMTLTGSVSYYYYYYSRQSGLYYSSDKSIVVSGTNVEVYWICDESWGLDDKVSFSASGDSEYDLSGWCTNSKGVQFSF